jgi:hypothetical protein
MVERVGDAEELVVDEADDVTAEFVGITVGAKFSFDVGTVGPLPKEFFERLLGFGLLAVEALLFEVNAAGKEFAAAEGDNIGEESADIAEVGLVLVGHGRVLGGGGVALGNPVHEVLDDWAGGELLERGRIGEGVGDELESGLSGLPLAEAILFVLREIGRGDGLALEELLEAGLDLGKGIEPGEDDVFGLAIGEALVDLLAESDWETRDFAEHSLNEEF